MYHVSPMARSTSRRSSSRSYMRYIRLRQDFPDVPRYPDMFVSIWHRSRTNPNFDTADFISAGVYSRMCPNTPPADSILLGISRMLLPLNSLIRFSSDAWFGDDASNTPLGRITRASSESTKFTRSTGKCSRTSENVTTANRPSANGSGSLQMSAAANRQLYSRYAFSYASACR